MENTYAINTQVIPELNDWEPTPNEEYYVYEDEVVRAKYQELMGLEDEYSPLAIFNIVKNHYKDRMPDIVKHLNYFLTFYDINKESFLSTMSIKFIISQKPSLKQKAFINLVIDRLITPSFVSKCKQMANDLYKLNINTDKEGKFKNTPKITNDQARQILALSFCFRFITPLCVHFSNTNTTFKNKKDYIPCFDKLFTRIIEIFEEDDIKVFTSLCRFIKYRVDKSYNSDKGIWRQKKQLYGHTKELYLEEVIHEVILVKSLHKLSYDKSCVSYIDGIIFGYARNFSKENYRYKPFELSEDDMSDDNDDFLSHAEALEMSVYRLDESNILISSVNTEKVLKDIKRRYGSIEITPEEFEFYHENIKINGITQFLLHSFYSKIFQSSQAIYTLNKSETILLIIYMKKYLQLQGMLILPEICSAIIKGKYKENVIKNTKFIEKMTSSSIYQNIIATKFKYVLELSEKDDPILRKLSGILNSTLTFVSYDATTGEPSDINGLDYDDIDVDLIISEFLSFLSII